SRKERTGESTMIVLLVQFTVKPGNEEKTREIIRIMQENTRREPGCRQYVGHQSTENPLQFMFYEVYDDQAALDAHRAAPYFKAQINGALDPIIETRSRQLYHVVE
ncbi:MAG: putative quinol monooxygenase, partial [Candidatus Korobacteraceae bacterium]